MKSSEILQFFDAYDSPEMFAKYILEQIDLRLHITGNLNEGRRGFQNLDIHEIAICRLLASIKNPMKQGDGKASLYLEFLEPPSIYVPRDYLVKQRNSINKDEKQFKNLQNQEGSKEFEKNLELKRKIYYKSMYMCFFQDEEEGVISEFLKDQGAGTAQEKFDVMIDCINHVWKIANRGFPLHHADKFSDALRENSEFRIKWKRQFIFKKILPKNYVGTVEEKINDAINCIKHGWELARRHFSLQNIYQLLDVLKKDLEFWTKERKKRTFIEILPMFRQLENNRLCEYFDQDFQKEMAGEIHTSLQKEGNIDEITVNEFKFYMQIIDKLKLRELQYDSSNLLHVLIQKAMIQKDCSLAFEKYKNLIQILLDGLNFEEKQIFLNYKNNFGLTPHQQFFMLAHIGDNTHQFNKNGAALAGVMLQYTVHLPIKCTNLWWSNFCNAVIQLFIGISFAELQKSSAFKNCEQWKAALLTVHATVLGYFTWKSITQNANAFRDTMIRSMDPEHSAKNDWNTKNLVMIGLSGYVDSYFAPFKVFGEGLHCALQNNSAGITNLENAIFNRVQLSEQLENMSLDEKKIACNTLKYRLEYLQYADKNPTIFQRVSNFFWYKHKISIIVEIQNCIKMLETDIKSAPEPKVAQQNLQSSLDEKYDISKPTVSQNLATTALNATANTIAAAGGLIGIKVEGDDIKDGIVTSISWMLAGTFEVLKGFGAQTVVQRG